jgi:hypothetical protein
MRTHHFLAVLLCGIVVALGGCATAPPPAAKPDYLSASFEARSITHVALAPVLDLRVDKSDALDLDATVHKIAKALMMQRGYAVASFADRSLVSGLQALSTREAMEPVVKDFVIPGGARHVLVLGLIDAYSKLTFGSTGNAEMVGYLVDQERRELLWSHKAVGQVGAGGLLGMALKSLMTADAIRMTAAKLMESIPPREPAH